jgi:hypothetical protein
MFLHSLATMPGTPVGRELPAMAAGMLLRHGWTDLPRPRPGDVVQDGATAAPSTRAVPGETALGEHPERGRRRDADSRGCPGPPSSNGRESPAGQASPGRPESRAHAESIMLRNDRYPDMAAQRGAARRLHLLGVAVSSSTKTTIRITAR